MCNLIENLISAPFTNLFHLSLPPLPPAPSLLCLCEGVFLKQVQNAHNWVISITVLIIFFLPEEKEDQNHRIIIIGIDTVDKWSATSLDDDEQK